MRTFIFEATNGFNWGKFLVGQFTNEWSQLSEVDTGAPLLRARGWNLEHVLVVDLETGEGAIFAVRPNAHPPADLQKHKIWVCPLFEPFLTWLYKQDQHRLHELSRVVQLHDAPGDLYGYRRNGQPCGQCKEPTAPADLCGDQVCRECHKSISFEDCLEGVTVNRIRAEHGLPPVAP